MVSRVRIECLRGEVTVAEDRYGVVSIGGTGKDDVLTALGYVHARDRLFQMDLLRRSSGGCLAVLFGESATGFDEKQRLLAFESVARAVVARLDTNQRQLVDAYVRGINRFLETSFAVAPEYLLLRQRPQPWRIEDSVLVLLGLFQQLALDIDGRRMELIMRATLPPEIVEFFLPTDTRPQPTIPSDALLRVLDGHADDPIVPLVTQHDWVVTGSNCWSIAAHKTARGVPLLCNDIHLAYSVPNIWYRAELRYASTRVAGVTIPGLPLIAAGANDVLAWGVTNLPGNLTALVPVEAEEPLTTRSERIEVRGQPDRIATFTDSEWGPLLPERACGKTVALQWSALWPESIDFGLLDLPDCATLDEAVAVARRSGGPPVNMHFAHREDGIAHTICGRVPKWEGDRMVPRAFVSSAAIPDRRNPPEGFVVSANDATAGQAPAEIGWNYPSSYRRKRIADCLALRDNWTEDDSMALMRDTRAGSYDFYHSLASAAVESAYASEWPDGLREGVRASLVEWDGHADCDSRGMPILFAYRRALQQQIVSWFLRPCVRADAAFRYTWRNPEPAVRRLLTDKPPSIVPQPRRYRDWDHFLAEVLRQCSDATAARLAWGKHFRVTMRHPMKIAFLRRWLDLASHDARGCDDTVLALAPTQGPCMRMAVAAGDEQSGLFQMPGGQSGLPWSRHYRDSHRDWLADRSAPFRPVRARTRLRLEP